MTSNSEHRFSTKGAGNMILTKQGDLIENIKSSSSSKSLLSSKSLSSSKLSIEEMNRLNSRK